MWFVVPEAFSAFVCLFVSVVVVVVVVVENYTDDAWKTISASHNVDTSTCNPSRGFHVAINWNYV